MSDDALRLTTSGADWLDRNAPYVLGMRSILYPLAAGNTVVFKG